MATRVTKSVSSFTEKLPSTAPFGPMGMVFLLCAALFAGCGVGDPKLAEALENIQHSDEAFRLEGLKTFSAMGEKGKSYADKIAALLKDTSSEVREMTVTLLADWEHSSPEVVQELGAMAAGDEDIGVQSLALSTLSMFGANDEFVKACKGILAGDDADLKSETLLLISESNKESVTALKAELEAFAGGSDEGQATDAKAALKRLEE